MRLALRNHERRGRPPPYFLSTAITTMMLVTGMNILTPVLPGYARSFGVSAAEVGAVVAAFALGRLLFDVIGGALLDRIGVRAVCTAGCLVTGIASLEAGFTDSFSVLLVARLFQGIGSALYMNAATTLVVALLPPGKAGRWMSAYQGIFLTGLAVGPLLGGAVAELFGLRAPFFAYAVMCLMGLVLSVAKLPSKAVLERLNAQAVTGITLPALGRLEALRRLLCHPAFAISLVIIVIMFVVRSGVRNTAVPLYAGEKLGMAAGSIGLLVTAAAVGQLSVMWHAGKVLDTRGRRPVVIISLFGAAGSIALLAMAFDPWRLMLVMFLLGLVTAYSTAAPTVILVDVTDPRIRGTAVGIQRMASDLGQLLGPLVIGLTLDRTTYPVAFVLTGAVVAATALLSLLLPETNPAHRARGALVCEATKPAT